MICVYMICLFLSYSINRSLLSDKKATHLEHRKKLLSVSIWRSLHFVLWVIQALCNLLKNKGVMERKKICECLLFLFLPCVSGFNIGLKGVAVSKGTNNSMHGYSLDFATKDNKVWWVNIHILSDCILDW